MKQIVVLRVFAFIFIISSYQVSFTASAAKLSGQTFGVWGPAPTLQMHMQHASRVNYQGLLPEATLVYQDLCQCDPALVRIVLDYVENIAHISYQDFKSSYEQDQLAGAIVSDVGKRIDQYVQRLKDHKISLAALPAHKEEVSKQCNDLVNEIKKIRENAGKHYSAPLAKLVCRIWMDFEKTDAHLKETLKKKNEAEQMNFKSLRHYSCMTLYSFLILIAQEIGLSQEMLAEDKTNQRQQRFLAVVHHAITKNAFYCFSPDYAKLELKNGIIDHSTQGRDAVKNYISAEYHAETLRWQLMSEGATRQEIFDAAQIDLKKEYQTCLVDCALLPSEQVRTVSSKYKKWYRETMTEYQKALDKILSFGQAMNLDHQESQARSLEQQSQQTAMNSMQRNFVEQTRLVLAKTMAVQRTATLKSWKQEEREVFQQIVQRQQDHEEHQLQDRENFDQMEQDSRIMCEIQEFDAAVGILHALKSKRGIMAYVSWLSRLQAKKQADFDTSLQRQTQRQKLQHRWQADNYYTQQHKKKQLEFLEVLKKLKKQERSSRAQSLQRQTEREQQESQQRAEYEYDARQRIGTISRRNELQVSVLAPRDYSADIEILSDFDDQ